MKIIYLVLIICALIAPLSAEQDIEVLNAGVVETTNDAKIHYFSQGETIVIRDKDRNCSSIRAFGSKYDQGDWNEASLLFIGVGADQESGDYLITAEDCGNPKQDILLRVKVLETAYPKTRVSRYTAPPNPRVDRQQMAVTLAFIKGQILKDSTLGQSYVQPLANLDVIDPFGLIYENNPYRRHQGVDLKVPVGSPVRAANRGAVALVAKNYRAEGNMLIINHGAGIFSVYMHLSRINVKDGQIVERGQIVALSGRTGAGVREPHLHFNIRLHNAYVDPLNFIETANKYLQ